MFPQSLPVVAVPCRCRTDVGFRIGVGHDHVNSCFLLCRGSLHIFSNRAGDTTLNNCAENKRLFYHLQRISCRIVLFCVTEKVFFSFVVHRTHLATCDCSCKFYNNFNSPHTEPHKCFSFISLPSFFLCVSFYSSFYIIYLLNVYKVAIIVTDPTLDVVAQQLRMCEHDTL